jgi:hypothetical protein
MFRAIFGTTEELAENLRIPAEIKKNQPSAAKAGAILLDLAARINPCPFKTASSLSFSASCEVVPFQSDASEALPGAFYT